MFLPSNILERILQFMSTKAGFPFIREDELIAIFFLFGKDHQVRHDEINAAVDLAKRTVDRLARDIRIHCNLPSKVDSEFIRENYTKRSLQIVVDHQNQRLDNSNQSQNSLTMQDNSQYELIRRVASDPAILSDCFVQHVANHKQSYFFQLFGPFRKDQVPHMLHDKLDGRMLMLGFNKESATSLPFASPVETFFRWLEKQK